MTRLLNAAKRGKLARMGWLVKGLDLVRTRPLLSLLMVALTLPGSIRDSGPGAHDQWRTTGPPGAQVLAFAFAGSPARLYAGTTNGVFLSEDAGGQWSSASLGLGDAPIVGGISSAGHGFPFFAAVARSGGALGGGIYRSDDGGSHWANVTASIADVSYAQTVSTDIQNPSIVFASIATADGELFRSLDSGATWTNVSGPIAGVVQAIAVDPIDDRNVYVANSSFWRSTDGGATFVQAGGGLPGSPMDDIVIDPDDPSTLYVPTLGHGVYVSHDAGTSFSPVGAGITDPDVDSLSMDPTDSRTLYAGTSFDGAFKSTDGGTTWLPVSQGLPLRGGLGAVINTIAVDPRKPSRVYLGISALDGSLYRTIDGGTDWTRSWTGLSGDCVWSLAALSISGTTLLAGDGGLTGVARSQAGSNTWRSSGAGLANMGSQPRVNAIVADPTNPATVYVGTFLGRSAVYRSQDGGITWTPDGRGIPGDAWSLAIDASDPLTLYVATANGVFKTVDGGAHWRSTGLTDQYVQSVNVDSTDPNVMYAGTRSVTPSQQGGVWTSQDGGGTWQLALPLAAGDSTWTVATDPEDGSVYAETGPDSTPTGHVIMRSSDHGLTWEVRTTGFPPASHAFAFLADPVRASTVYAAASDGGVYRTVDAGLHWQALNQGLFDLNVTSLAIDPSATHLFAGTCVGGGVFTRALP